MKTDSPWLIVHEGKGEPRLRLFCFHYAGATAAAFRTWRDSLPDWVELIAVQLPGRDYRMDEPLIDDAEPIVAELAKILPPLLDRPYVFFGHSMGALISRDLAHSLRAQGLPEPDLFIASGRSAPRFRWLDAGAQALPDDAFIETVRDYNGTPEELITEPALRELWMPRLRADLTVSAMHRYIEQPPLACPMLVLHGTVDRLVTAAGLAGWAAETTGPVRYVRYPGNHFFLHSEEKALLADLSEELRRLAAGERMQRQPLRHDTESATRGTAGALSL
ncbi:alpha/beta fold hydrolase [Ramlibacter sp.]|uniref:thioesterase II family protein n=1 Tax=Ramlibacter sp. TaxID=1917967 RepID=UPI0017B661C3|nr:alpha/beta fold hydrolase [Ramlibacter sp.]MBA2675219.1 thioesterase [Ramlibacter sp.]